MDSLQPVVDLNKYQNDIREHNYETLKKAAENSQLRIIFSMNDVYKVITLRLSKKKIVLQLDTQTECIYIYDSVNCLFIRAKYVIDLQEIESSYYTFEICQNGGNSTSGFDFYVLSTYQLNNTDLLKHLQSLLDSSNENASYLLKKKCLRDFINEIHVSTRNTFFEKTQVFLGKKFQELYDLTKTKISVAQANEESQMEIPCGIIYTVESSMDLVFGTVKLIKPWDTRVLAEFKTVVNNNQETYKLQLFPKLVSQIDEEEVLDDLTYGHLEISNRLFFIEKSKQTQLMEMFNRSKYEMMNESDVFVEEYLKPEPSPYRDVLNDFKNEFLSLIWMQKGSESFSALRIQ